MSSASLDTTGPSKWRDASFWIRELPFSLVLVAITLGVAYGTFSRRPDYQLLGGACADHWTSVRRRRVAPRKRQGRTLAVDMAACVALDSVLSKTPQWAV